MDPYRTLGIPRSAGTRTIKRAFKALAWQFHPDRNPGDEGAAERMREVNAAYELLLDPGRRALHEAAATPRPAQRRYAAARPNRGSAQVEVMVDLEHALRGGPVLAQIHAAEGAPTALLVDLPAGVGDGDVVHVRHRDPARGTVIDVQVRVRVRADADLVRDGIDLIVVREIPALVAYGGGVHPIDTPWGPARIRVPPGCQSGDRIRKQGFGVRRPGRPPGALIVIARVVLPAPGDAALGRALLWGSLEGGAEAGRDPAAPTGLASHEMLVRAAIDRRFHAARAGSEQQRRGVVLSLAPDRLLQGALEVDLLEAVLGIACPVALRLDDSDPVRLDVRLPAGIAHGTFLRLRAVKLPGLGAVEVRLQIRVREPEWLHRDGNDLHLHLPISAAEAYGGATLEVPTPWGTERMQVSAGARCGDRLRVPGAGVRGGDLVATLDLRMPAAGNEALLQALKASGAS